MNRDSKQKTAFEQQEETPQRGSCRDTSSQGWGSKELYHSASSLAASMQNQISSSNYSAIDMGFLCLEKCSCLGLLLSGYNTGDQCVEEFLEKDEPGEEKGCASRKLAELADRPNPPTRPLPADPVVRRPKHQLPARRGDDMALASPRPKERKGSCSQGLQLTLKRSPLACAFSRVPPSAYAVEGTTDFSPFCGQKSAAWQKQPPCLQEGLLGRVLVAHRLIGRIKHDIGLSPAAPLLPQNSQMAQTECALLIPMFHQEPGLFSTLED
ncbi:hypothetical protein MG293_015963 [Ovis ammon polii]|uniref:Uncharacterized protein n=1 Tax=Ovis ammon polii TaxID=230172 RepID=A0AAD4Y2S5_OVIAM|nr:hypothetical protein MG293_015963 [Ovis ammon polii]